MIVERRWFLELPALAAGAALLGVPAVAAARGAKSPLTFDELAREMGALARELRKAQPKNEEAYLARVTALVARLGGTPDAQYGELWKGVIQSALTYRGSWLALVQWRMGPNLAYQAHNHPNYNQVTLGIEGECRIRNWQPVGAAPARDAGPFEVRVTQDNLLLPGGVASIFSTTRDNIHDLESGPAGVRGMDLMTLVGEHVGFSFVDIARDPTDARRRVHRATWGDKQAG